jgi:hypothetical protein
MHVSNGAKHMKRCFRVMAIAALISLEQANVALAGMPMTTLSDLARMRLQTISFFLLLFLVCSWVVRLIWNAARRDFPWLPHLSFRRATGLVALWGLLFLLVLTMISGARELMTPGAWKKEGFTYKLKDEDDPAKTVANEREAERRAALDRLRAALWTYARHHDGHFPANDSPPEIPDSVWRVPDPSAMKYIYIPGLIADQGTSLLLSEPAIFGTSRLALLTDGKIVSMTESDPSASSAVTSPAPSLPVAGTLRVPSAGAKTTPITQPARSGKAP